MDKKAFTLIELIAVIMIISIIIGIALPRFSGVKDEALITKAKGEMRTIQSALEAYYMHQSPNSYPETSTDLINDSLLNASPQIVPRVLYDPFRNDSVEYNYFLSDNGRYYVILSVGPDGEGDITGINDDGDIVGIDDEDEADDDIYVTNDEGGS